MIWNGGLSNINPRAGKPARRFPLHSIKWYFSTDWHKHVYSSALIVYGGYKTIQAAQTSPMYRQDENGYFGKHGKHKKDAYGDISADPFWNNYSAGQESLNSAYSSTRTKQLYNVYDGKLVKFQPDNAGTWHAYEVTNPAVEVPTDVLRNMHKDGVISKAQYLKWIKGK